MYFSEAAQSELFQERLADPCFRIVALRFLQSHGEPSWRTEQVLKGVYKAVISAQRDMIMS